MNTILWLVLGLAVCNGLILVLLYLTLRRHAPLGRQALFAIGAGLAGFIVHALMFLSGGFLIVQLATISGAFGICLCAPRKPMQKE